MIRFPVLTEEVMGVRVYRGYAKLSDLARISRPDIYDAEKNPTGTQRDLSPRHAKEAYEYIHKNDFGYWPEVFLCVRDSTIMKFRRQKGMRSSFGILSIDDERAKRASKISISRVDGNHRLHYADGAEAGFEPIDKMVSFCIAADIDLLKELTIFRDINNNQKRMNTSHLDKIEVRLSGEDFTRRKEPALFVAHQLANDKSSPFYKIVYEGGKKKVGSFIGLRALHTGIEYMFSRPTKLKALNDVDAQYKLIKNYFTALKKYEPEAWKDPGSYLLLRGSGLWGACFIGAEIIDRTLGQGRFKSDDMLKILRSGKKWDWSNNGEFQGYGGRGGAAAICEAFVRELVDDAGVSVQSLYRKIMAEG